MGPDARNGDQPRYTRVVGNLVREVSVCVRVSECVCERE